MDTCKCLECGWTGPVDDLTPAAEFGLDSEESEPFVCPECGSEDISHS